MTDEFTEQMRELYGEPAEFSEYQRGDHIAYTVDGQQFTGEILWVASDYVSTSGRHIPAYYVVARDGRRNSFPDEIFFSHVLTS